MKKYIYNSEQKLRYCPSQPYQSAKVARFWLKKKKEKEKKSSKWKRRFVD